MEILNTQDYSLFQRINGNRVVSKPHVRRLRDAMEEDPTTVTYNPIIVNKDWEVIDGQHRLEAMEELGLPVYFIKVDELDLTNVQKLNSVAKQWTPIDYAKSFRELGNKHYKIYLDFKGEFGFNHEVLMRYLSLDNYATSTAFKRGTFKVSDIELSHKYCEWLRDFSEYYERATLRNQASGYLSIIRNPVYDHSHFMAKLKKHIDKLQEQKKPNDYAREFERIYNFHTQRDAIRLF